MQPGYISQLNTSFFLFLDHKLCSNGGYKNLSGSLYSTQDPNYSEYKIYGSPFRQFVADSSISGATICSGINVSGTFWNGGIWDEVEETWDEDFTYWNGIGLTIDFQRGRAVSDTTLTDVTAAYAIKDFNIYYNFLEEPDLLIDRTFQVQSVTNRPSGALNWRDEPVPCVYITPKFNENVPWAFGGTDRSDTRMECIVLATNKFNLDAACSLLSATARTNFPLFPVELFPFGVLGGLKYMPYNYETLCNSLTNMVYISKVKVSKFDQSLNKQLNKGMWGAFIDFSLQFQRNPRVYYSS